jgi:hypothetical protein
LLPDTTIDKMILLPGPSLGCGKGLETPFPTPPPKKKKITDYIFHYPEREVFCVHLLNLNK